MSLLPLNAYIQMGFSALLLGSESRGATAAQRLRDNAQARRSVNRVSRRGVGQESLDYTGRGSAD